MNILVSFLVGLALPLLMGATTDQIWQNVYDLSNTALRVNVVAGGGGSGNAPTGCTNTDGNPISCPGFASTSTKPGLLVNGPVSSKVATWLGTSTDGILINSSGTASANVIATAGTSLPSLIQFIGSNGTITTPTALTTNDFYGELDFVGYNSADAAYNYGASIVAYASGNFSSANSYPTNIGFFDGPNTTETWRFEMPAGNFVSSKAGVVISMKEGSAPSGAAGQDILYADSTAHRFKVNSNNGGAQTLAYSSEITTSKTSLIASATSNAGTAAANFLSISGVQPMNTAVTYYQFLPAGTLKNMVCGMAGSFTAQTSTKSYTVTIESIDGATALTCTINSASTCPNLAHSYFGTGVCCEDTTHTVTVPAPSGANNGYYYRFTPANTPNAGPPMCTVEFDQS